MRVCRGLQLALVPWGAAGVPSPLARRQGNLAGYSSRVGGQPWPRPPAGYSSRVGGTWPRLFVEGRRGSPVGNRANFSPLGTARTSPRSPRSPGSPAAPGGGGRFQMWRGAGEGPSAIGTVLGKELWPGGRESPASGRDSGRAREDSRGSFRLEWLRIEFWRHQRKLFSKPTLELRRLAPARGGGIRWISGGAGDPLFFSGRCAGP